MSVQAAGKTYRRLKPRVPNMEVIGKCDDPNAMEQV